MHLMEINDNWVNSVHDADGDDAHLMMMIEIHIKYNINYSKKRLDNYEKQ